MNLKIPRPNIKVEWRPIRTSALIFGIMFLIALAMVNTAFYHFIQQSELTLDAKDFIVIATLEIGAITVFGTAIAKLVEDSPPPAPTVPADVYKQTLEVMQLAINQRYKPQREIHIAKEDA